MATLKITLAALGFVLAVEPVSAGSQIVTTPPSGVAYEEPPQDVAHEFAAARYDEIARVVRFWPMLNTDWEKVARRNFRRFSIDRPSPRAVSFMRGHILDVWGGAEFKVSAPLDPRMAAGTYSLMTAGGLLPLHPAKLEASIVFGFDNATTPHLLPSRRFSGEVLSYPMPSGDGGIVYWSTKKVAPVRIAQAHAEIHKDGALVVLSYADENSKAATSWPQPSGRSDFVSAYGLTIGAQRYLFVAWSPDSAGIEAGCLHQFSLYRVRDALEEVANSDYGCDV